MQFKMPDIGEGVAEGEIVSWKVKVGDRVKEEQDFVEVMTDKATVTITVPTDGVIKELCFKDGDVVPVHTVIAVIDTETDTGRAAPAAEEAPSTEPVARSPDGPTVAASSTPAPAAAPPTSAPAASAAPSTPVAAPAASVASAVGTATVTVPASPGKVVAAPATRRRAREAGIELSLVPGTGPGGRVTNEDLERYLAGGAPAVAAAPGAPVTEPAVAPALAQAPREPVSIPSPAAPELEERVPFRGVRKKIADAMTRAKFTATHFSVVDDLDVTDLVKLRTEAKERYAGEGVKVTYMPFIMKAVVAGLRAHPWLNSALDEAGQEVVIKRYYNIGIATDTPNGLIVPVIRDVDRKSMVQLARELQDLAGRTREGKVHPDELKGSTFTITNAGNLGGLFATPIINFPEVAILGVHKIQKTPRVVDGEIRVRDVMYLSVSIDHRIVDGAEGLRFLNVVKSCLEDPRKLMLEA